MSVEGIARQRSGLPTEPAVLVVGAGPVGLTAACQLARLGVAVRVVDALEQPTTESRAVGVHARSLELLASLGVLPRLESRGRRIAALEVVSGRTGETRARLELGEAPTRHPYLLDVAQPDTEEVLAERATELGVVVERGVELTGLVQDPDGVTVTLRTRAGDRTARVGWVVGADGGHSTTRRLLGVHLEGGFSGQHFAMADVDVDTPWPADTIRMCTHPDGMGVLFPLAGDRARVMFSVEPPDPGAGDPTLDQVQALADARMGGQVRLRDPRWLTWFEVHHAQVAEYRHGRVLLAGDAAHVHSPAGAQGMNTGIQDATNLAWKLALVVQDRASADLLDTYHDERHPVGAQVVRSTTVLTDVGTASGPAAALRDAALFVVGHVRRLGATAATTMAELSVHYRGSPLSVRHRSDHHRADHHRPDHRGLRPGDRAPDPVGLRRRDGTPVAVEELLARPGLVALARSTDPDRLAGLRRALDGVGTVVRVVRDPAATDPAATDPAATDPAATDPAATCPAATDPAVTDPAATGDAEWVVDADDVLGRDYGLGSEGIALIRPDGYLGLLADSADPDVLRRYLVDAVRIREVPAAGGRDAGEQDAVLG